MSRFDLIWVVQSCMQKTFASDFAQTGLERAWCTNNQKAHLSQDATLHVVPICRTSPALRCRANQNDALAHPAPIRGAARDRHGHWERDAMDAHRRAQLLRDERRVCGRRNRVVLALQCRRSSREDAFASHGRRWQPSMVTGEIAYKP